MVPEQTKKPIRQNKKPGCIMCGKVKSIRIKQQKTKAEDAVKILRVFAVDGKADQRNR